MALPSPDSGARRAAFSKRCPRDFLSGYFDGPGQSLAGAQEVAAKV